MDNTEILIESLKSMAYKGRFSIYHRPEITIVRTYKRDGSQYKVTGETITKALSNAIEILIH